MTVSDIRHLLFEKLTCLCASFCISKTFEFNTSDVFQNIFINPDEVLLFLCMLIQLHLILFALMFTVLFTVM